MQIITAGSHEGKIINIPKIRPRNAREKLPRRRKGLEARNSTAKNDYVHSTENENLNIKFANGICQVMHLNEN